MIAVDESFRRLGKQPADGSSEEEKEKISIQYLVYEDQVSRSTNRFFFTA